MDPLSHSCCEPVTVTGGLRRPVKTESFVKRTDSLSRFFGKSQQKSPPNGSKWHFPAVNAGMTTDRKNPPVLPSRTILNTAKNAFFAVFQTIIPRFPAPQSSVVWVFLPPLAKLGCNRGNPSRPLSQFARRRVLRQISDHFPDRRCHRLPPSPLTKLLLITGAPPRKIDSS